MSMFVDRFFGTGNDIDPADLPSDYRSALEPWIQRFEHGEGIAFLPRSHGGVVRWYGLTPGGNERRELEGLLLRWLGATYTDMARSRGVLDPGDPFDAWLEEALPGRVVRFEVWPRGSTAHRETVRENLGRLVRLLDDRPPRKATRLSRLKTLIDDLYKAADAGGREAATDVLEEIEARRLLDTANLLFLRVRMLDLLNAWEEILAPDLLGKLEKLRVPPGVGRSVSRAVRELHLSSAEADPNVHRNLRQQLPPEITSVVGQLPLTDDPKELIVRAVVARPDDAVVDRIRSITDDPQILGLLPDPPGDAAGGDHREGSEGPHTGDPGEDLESRFSAACTSFDHARILEFALLLDLPLSMFVHTQVVQAAYTLGEQKAATTALDLVRRDLGDPSGVRWPFPGLEALVQTLEQREAGKLPTSWDDWLALAAAGDHRLEDIHPEPGWPMAAPDQLLAALDEIDESILRRSFGVLRAGHHESMSTEQRALLGLRGLWLHFGSGSTGEPDRLAVGEMLSDALDAPSPDLAELADIMQVLITAHAGAATVDWVSDVLGELIQSATGPDDRTRIAELANTTIDLLRPFWTSVSRSTYESLVDSMATVGTALPPDLVRRDAQMEEPSPHEHMRGKRILIYTLRPRPAERAAAVLRRMDGTQVRISSAHDGDPQLKAQAREADAVLIVTKAAKHAATGFIEQNVQSQEAIIHVNAVGTASILHAIALQP